MAQFPSLGNPTIRVRLSQTVAKNDLVRLDGDGKDHKKSTFILISTNEYRNPYHFGVFPAISLIGSQLRNRRSTRGTRENME